MTNDDEISDFTVTIMRDDIGTLLGARVHYGEHWWSSYSVRMFL